MHVRHLTLSNFRNYATADIELKPGVNVLVGSNGQGKTNLVEAIQYVSTLRSHRVAGYEALIRVGQPQAIVRLLARWQDRENLIEVELNRDSPNRARVNRADVSRVRDILGYVTSVIFAPEDLRIIKEDPSDRRDFIDGLIVQSAPRFAGVYADYERVLKQRNTLLRSARAAKSNAGLSTLEAWDEQLVQYGSEIIAARVALVAKLEPLVNAAYAAIADEKNDPAIRVKSSILATVGFDDELEQSEYLTGSDKSVVAEIFAAKLLAVRDRELERGVTLVGPHRDDLVFTLGSLPAKGYISHGETWSYALALRLASVQLLKVETKTGDPILILDDVFAELDVTRRTRLANLVADNEQVIITAAVAADIPAELAASTYHVRAGVIAAESQGAGGIAPEGIHSQAAG
jgi:DNA replication and repair protein RecF